jgi:hypothetical protein
LVDTITNSLQFIQMIFLFLTKEYLILYSVKS